MKKLYRVVSLNMEGLGGSVETDRMFKNWEKFVSNIEKGKELCQKDYNKSIRGRKIKLEWRKFDDGITTGDLHFVMYSINPVKVDK